MKIIKTLFAFLILVFICSCDEPNLYYQESAQESILTKDLEKSPDENLKAFFVDNNLEMPTQFRIYNNSGLNCGCTKTTGNCYCKLPNSSSASCSEAATNCTKDKYIKIYVPEEQVEKYKAIGFKSF